MYVNNLSILTSLLILHKTQKTLSEDMMIDLTWLILCLKIYIKYTWTKKTIKLIYFFEWFHVVLIYWL